MSRPRRRPSISQETLTALRLFVDQHPELDIAARADTELARLIVYWAVEIQKMDSISYADVGQLFSAVDVDPPEHIKVVLSQLKSEGHLIKLGGSGGGYRPSATLKAVMKNRLGSKTPLQEADSHLVALLAKVSRPDAKDFLEEAHLSLRAGASRAAIVMTWIVTVDHLYEFVLRHKSAEFNSELAKKFPKLDPITTKDDFLELQEKDFIVLCRSAFLTNDVRKILDEKLGIRNTAGHPSTVKVHRSKSVNFIEDLVENVILKFPL